MTQALPHAVQLVAEIGQAVGQGVQLGGAATGSVGAAPFRGGVEHLVQLGHRAEVVRERLVEQLGELLGTGGSKAVDQPPVGAMVRGLRPEAAPPPWTRWSGRGTVDGTVQLRVSVG